MVDGKENPGIAVAGSALTGGTTTSTTQAINSATATSVKAAEATKSAIEVGSKVQLTFSMVQESKHPAPPWLWRRVPRRGGPPMRAAGLALTR